MCDRIAYGINKEFDQAVYFDFRIDYNNDQISTKNVVKFEQIVPDIANKIGDTFNKIFGSKKETGEINKECEKVENVGDVTLEEKI